MWGPPTKRVTARPTIRSKRRLLIQSDVSRLPDGCIEAATVEDIQPPDVLACESYAEPGSRATVKSEAHVAFRLRPDRSAADSGPDGRDHGPRVPPDAAPDRGRGAGDDGVHLVGGRQPRQRAADSQDGLLERGTAALDPDLRLGRGAHGGGCRGRRGARPRRL